MGDFFKMKKFKIRIKGYIKTFWAEDFVDGVLVNPKLPKNFDNTPNDSRPSHHQKFWGLPFVQTMSTDDWDRHYADRTDEWADAGRSEWAKKGRKNWLKVFPDGKRYEVRCLDGGAWDRCTWWGHFTNLDEAIDCAYAGPARRKNTDE